MYTWEIEDVIFSNNGIITREMFDKIYDSEQMICCFINEGDDYLYEVWLRDKQEPLLFNIQN